MKSMFKRCGSVLLALLLLVSVCSGLTLTADAASYGYNNGVRGRICTSLSSAAKGYYPSGYDYETLSKLSGAALESKLKTLMAEGYNGSNSYNGLKTIFQHTDAYQGSSTQMYFFYSGVSGSSNMNREHVWPKSLSNGQFYEDSNTAGADMHHLRPADAYVNSARSNKPFGEVTGGTYSTAYTKSGKVGGYYNAGYFEPLDGTKGDCARIILYVYTRWDQRNIKDVFQNLDLLLKWCELDPVDEFEMQRNDIAQQYTNSRNVYIDYPEYCWLVLGKAVPTHMTTPSGKGKTCNNANYTESITTPAKCTTNGVKTYTCKNCGYSYTEVIPATGHHYVNGKCTVCGKLQSATQYIYAPTIAAGDKVVIFNTTNKKVVTTTSSPYTNSSGVTYQQLAAAGATLEGQELICSSENMAVFTVVKSGSNYAFKLDDGRYLSCEEAQNLSLVASPKSGTNYWTLESSGTNTYYLKNTTTYYETYQKNYQYLEFYANKFTTYGWNGTNDGPYATTFYKQVAGAVCEHDYQVIASKGASCTEGGYTTYQCSKCSDTYTTYTEALGHKFENGVCTVCGAADPDAADSECPFVDVPANEWYYNSVIWATSTTPKITSGVDATHFAPNKNCTRAEVVQFLWNANGQPSVEASVNPFNDVRASDWFYKAVLWAVSQGITSGTTETTFSPNKVCTRAEVVTFLWNAHGNPAPESLTIPFIDVTADQWYTNAVLWAVERKVTSGTGDGSTFSPTTKCTRAQIVTFLYKDQSVG